MAALTGASFAHLEQTCPNVALVYGTAMLLTMTLWCIFLCLWPFPEPASTPDLMHSTPRSAWEAIKDSGGLYPTADARIYLVDREVILGRKSGDGKNMRLVFAQAKQRGIAVPARFCPLQYLRFKAARGEWVAPRHHYLHIKDFVETPGSDTITITGYNLEKLPPNMRRSLLARECVSYLILTAPTFCMLTSTLAIDVVCGDSTFVTAIPWWVRLGVPAALMLAWYQLQHWFNARLFRMARRSNTGPDCGQLN